MIYELLLVYLGAIWIRSPRKKHQRKKSFASILKVNKQINSEAKAIFWGNNKIVLGNGMWGDTTDPNLHALQHFIARVPKDCIRLIRFVEVEIHCELFWTGTYHYTNDGPIQIQRALSKYFSGIEVLAISAIQPKLPRPWRMLEYSRHNLSRVSIHCARCQSPRKALGLMASLPSLETIIFKVEKRGKLDDLAITVILGQPGILDKLKIGGIEDGHFVVRKGGLPDLVSY